MYTVSWLVAKTRVSDLHENDRTCTNKGIFVTEFGALFELFNAEQSGI